MSVRNDSQDGMQLLDAINKLKLEFIKHSQTSSQTDIIKLKEAIAAKRSMIEKIDYKIQEWKVALDILIPKLNTYKERSFRSEPHQEFEIKDANDIIPYLSSIEESQLMDQSE